MKSEQQTFIILVENILLFLSCKSNFTTFNVQSFCLTQARSEHPRPHRHCCNSWMLKDRYSIRCCWKPCLLLLPMMIHNFSECRQIFFSISGRISGKRNQWQAWSIPFLPWRMKVTNVSMKLRESFHNIHKGPFSKYSEISFATLVTTPPCSSAPCLLCVFTFVFWNSKSSGSVAPGLYFTNHNRLIL